MKHTTRSVLAWIGVGAVVAVFAFVGVVSWFVVSHRDSLAASPQAAEAEFSQLRARFANQAPLVDIARRPVEKTDDVPRAATSLRSFHTVVFDTRGGLRIVRIAVPYWFARRFAGPAHEFIWLGQLTFLDDTEFDPDAIRLSLDQLERRGPGLVADHQHPGGGQFISWVE